MTIKQLHERLRLLKPEEKISITAGEVRALLNYSMALVAEEVGTMVDGAHAGARLASSEVVLGPAFDALRSISYYVQNMPGFAMAKACGARPCTMELDE